MFAASNVETQIPLPTLTTSLYLTIIIKKSAHDECTFRNNSYLCTAVLRKGQ